MGLFGIPRQGVDVGKEPPLRGGQKLDERLVVCADFKMVSGLFTDE